MNGRLRFGMVVAPLIITAGLYILSYLYTDYLWFESLHYAIVFIRILEYKVKMFLLGFSISLIVLLLNSELLKRGIREFLGEDVRYPRWLDVLISTFIGYVFSNYWIYLEFFQNGVDFGLKDPIFGMDVSFYTFKLPFLELLTFLVLFSLIISLAISLIFYLHTFRWVKTFEELKELFPQTGYTHLAILLSSILLVVSMLFFLYRYNVLSSQHGIVAGANWTDVHVVIPMLALMTLVGLVTSLAMFHFGRRGFDYMGFVLALYVIVAVVLLVALPLSVQRFKVEPNELEMEWNYISYSIQFTNYAYGLSNVDYKVYNVSYNLTYDKIERNRGTIDNVRLWDYRPIKEVFRQLQQIRPYYVIHDVDVDRYVLNGKYTEVMVSARELSTNLLPSNARTWINVHLIYTHGFGIVMAPVNVVSKEGLPEFVVKDIPPKGVLKIDQPRIYFGEETNDYVIVDTARKEFDYPLGSKNVFTTYKGSGGVVIGNGIRRMLFSMRFGDVNLLLSNDVKPNSRILFHRNVEDRVRTIAPFLKFDSDPYVAVINGKIYWIIDAYTTLGNFPYSRMIATRFGLLNYIRNPVKVFVDAYNGTVKFYLVSHDPVIDTLSKAFPIFDDKMPVQFRRHVRYPINLFEIQAEVYTVYHMKNVETFYNKEDVWEIPTELYEGNVIKMEPYYVMLSLDGKPEFVLMLPFTPKGRRNMIAWMCARCDYPHYGELVLYEFPKGKLIFGPMQIEARIDQNPTISKLFTLWGQVGSSVIRGNLLVIPIEGSIIYVEPIYLKAVESQIPELRGVIVAYDERLVMKPTLDEALRSLFGVPSKVNVTKNVAEVIEECVRTYKKAMESVKSGDWAEFGRMLERLGELIERLNESVGG